MYSSAINQLQRHYLQLLCKFNLMVVYWLNTDWLWSACPTNSKQSDPTLTESDNLDAYIHLFFYNSLANNLAIHSKSCRFLIYDSHSVGMNALRPRMWCVCRWVFFLFSCALCVCVCACMHACVFILPKILLYVSLFLALNGFCSGKVPLDVNNMVIFVQNVKADLFFSSSLLIYSKHIRRKNVSFCGLSWKPLPTFDAVQQTVR